MACEAFPGEDGALVRTWLGGLLVRGLCLPEGLTVEQAAREREGARAAAEELAGEGAGLAAQVLAAQFVSRPRPTAATCRRTRGRPASASPASSWR
jgi:hypothetical protein